jgi:hypothetical protein
MPAITVTNTIFIAASQETVWDFTQDYNKRHNWDKTVLAAKIIQEQPRVALIKGIGGLTTELHYKLDERPHKTSLAMFNTKSPFIQGGGGYWHYDTQDGGTLWTQTNSLILKKSLLALLLSPLMKWILKTNTRKAMQATKRIIEGQEA